MQRSTVWRREWSDWSFPPSTRRRVLLALRSGVPLRQAMDAVAMSEEAAYGRARWDSEWEDALNFALLEGRDPHVVHGHWRTYADGCSCPECRAINPNCRRARMWLERHGIDVPAEQEPPPLRKRTVDRLLALQEKASRARREFPPDHPACRASAELARRLNDLRLRGHSMQGLSRVLGMSPSMVRHRLVRHGYIGEEE